MRETRLENRATRAALAALCWLTFSAASAPAGESPVREFDSPGDFASWRGEGIEDGGPAEGGLQVLGGERFQLYSPAGVSVPAGAEAYLRVRLRAQSPRYFLVLGRNRDGRMIPVSDPVAPPLDADFHTFWVPLAGESGAGGENGRVGLAFGGRPGWVEIDSVEIRPFSTGLYLRDQWREFLLPRRLNPGTINSLGSPRLFGRPAAEWLSILAAAVVLLAALLYLPARRGRRRLIATGAGLVLLSVWVAYDVRESFSQYGTVKEIHDLYVKPPPGEKLFPALGDFYGFVDLCREVIPESAQYNFYSAPMWPYDCRVQYFLHPRGIKSATWNRYDPEEAVAYHAVYREPSVFHDPESRRLYRREEGVDRAVSRPGGIVGRFGAESFIFREDEVTR